MRETSTVLRWRSIRAPFLIAARDLFYVVVAAALAAVQPQHQRISVRAAVANRHEQAIRQFVALLVDVHLFAEVDVVLGEIDCYRVRSHDCQQYHRAAPAQNGRAHSQAIPSSLWLPRLASLRLSQRGIQRILSPVCTTTG